MSRLTACGQRLHEILHLDDDVERQAFRAAYFMSETLYEGRRVRLLTILDEGNREGLEIAMGMSLPSRRVVRALNELIALHGRPSAVRVDNGPEFTAQSFIDWCAEHRVAMHYIQPGKPDQNAYIERFNRGYRTEVLNAHLFEIAGRTARAHQPVAARLQPGAAPRQPRGGAAAEVSPEAFISRKVSYRTVGLIGELTAPTGTLNVTLVLVQVEVVIGTP